MSSEKILSKILTREELEILNELPNFKKLVLMLLSQKDREGGEELNSGLKYAHKKERSAKA